MIKLCMNIILPQLGVPIASCFIFGSSKTCNNWSLQSGGSETTGDSNYKIIVKNVLEKVCVIKKNTCVNNCIKE